MEERWNNKNNWTIAFYISQDEWCNMEEKSWSTQMFFGLESNNDQIMLRKLSMDKLDLILYLVKIVT